MHHTTFGYAKRKGCHDTALNKIKTLLKTVYTELVVGRVDLNADDQK